MDESLYKNRIVELLASVGWLIQLHEDRFSRYVPDLSFSYNGVDGWIEVKYLPKPKKLFKIDHLTIGQISWLEKRADAGCGACFLLVGTPLSQHLIPAHNVRGAVGRPWGQAVAASYSVQTGQPEDMANLLNKIFSPVLTAGLNKVH